MDHRRRRRRREPSPPRPRAAPRRGRSATAGTPSSRSKEARCSCPRGSTAPPDPLVGGQPDPPVADHHDGVEPGQPHHPRGARRCGRRRPGGRGSGGCAAPPRFRTRSRRGRRSPATRARAASCERAAHRSAERDPQALRHSSHGRRSPANGSGRQIRSATSPVQPVWWLAPSPAPLSPWKYSLNVMLSRHRGSSCSLLDPAVAGAAAVGPPQEQRDQPPPQVVGARRQRDRVWPLPVGYSISAVAPSDRA